MTDKKTHPGLHVVVVGGGFGGIKAALELSRQDHLKVTLVSDRPDFLYYPTLYETVTGGSSEQSAVPVEQIFADDPVTVIIGEAQKLDRTKKQLKLTGESEPLSYDKIIFALGSVTNYFGIPGLADNSYSVRSLDDAERLKRHLHAQLIAEDAPDPNYIIVGGGPTGIELAGALGVYLRDIMEKHGVKRSKPHIDLVEAMPHLMPRLPKPVGRAIERRLRKLGVKLYLGKKVEGATADELHVAGKPILSHTIIWTAGVANNPFFDDPQFRLSARRKVLVDEFLRLEGDKDVFIIGDNAETPYSGMAQTALTDADFIAHNFLCVQEAKPKLAYKPKEPVYITPVGPSWSSMLWGDIHVHGRIAQFFREAANLKAFTEILSVKEGVIQWTSTVDREDLCPICSHEA